MINRTRAISVIRWIERYCVVPSGPDKGQGVRLTYDDKETIARIYRDDGSLGAEPLNGQLAACVALLHVCGIEAPDHGPLPELRTDPWTVMAAAGPRARAVIARKADVITCPALGTVWPRRAA